MDKVVLIVGADRESVRTFDDKAFCRVFGVGNAFEATDDARAKTAELVRRWNSHEALVALAEYALSQDMLGGFVIPNEIAFRAREALAKP